MKCEPRVAYGAAHMGTSYSHLTLANRLTIETMLDLGHICRAIAQVLRENAATLSREVTIRA